MTLSGSEMKLLEAQSASFGEAHKSCLAEAINAIRGSGDPRAAVRLLTTLSQGARPQQKDAFVDVRRWLEGRLRIFPGSIASPAS